MRFQSSTAVPPSASIRLQAWVAMVRPALEAGHFKRSNAAQSIFGTNCSTYFVEAPSTMNELLLGHYLLKTNPDKRFRRWVLGNMVGNTYYHNFVTHLLEAAYQARIPGLWAASNPRRSCGPGRVPFAGAWRICACGGPACP